MVFSEVNDRYQNIYSTAQKEIRFGKNNMQLYISKHLAVTDQGKMNLMVCCSVAAHQEYFMLFLGVHDTSCYGRWKSEGSEF